ncbi:MAG: hypothetical protein IKZ88_01575 [Neisseriaceae bacterium]|nr:hypothetical protein [Neisseriaceae bacterium]
MQLVAHRKTAGFVVGWVSNPPNKPQGLCVKGFRLPEMISSVMVGKNAHPISTCGALVG